MLTFLKINQKQTESNKYDKGTKNILKKKQIFIIRGDYFTFSTKT